MNLTSTSSGWSDFQATVHIGLFRTSWSPYTSAWRTGQNSIEFNSNWLRSESHLYAVLNLIVPANKCSLGDAASDLVWWCWMDLLGQWCFVLSCAEYISNCRFRLVLQSLQVVLLYFIILYIEICRASKGWVPSVYLLLSITWEELC